MRGRDRADAGAVSAALVERMPSLAVDLLGPPTSQGRFEWRWRGKGSLGVHVAGPKRGRFFDNEAGVFNDALDLIVHVRGGSRGDAIRWALGWLGEDGVAGADAPRYRKAATGRAWARGRGRQDRQRPADLDRRRAAVG